MKAISWPFVGHQARNSAENGKMGPRYRMAGELISWPVGEVVPVGDVGQRCTSH